MNLCNIHIYNDNNKSLPIKFNLEYFTCYFSDIYFWSTSCKFNSSCTITFTQSSFQLNTPSNHESDLSFVDFYQLVSVPTNYAPDDGHCLFVKFVIKAPACADPPFPITVKIRDNIKDCINDDKNWQIVSFPASYTNNGVDICYKQSIVVVSCYSAKYDMIDSLQASNNYLFQIQNTNPKVNVEWQYYLAINPDLIRNDAYFISMIFFAVLSAVLIITLSCVAACIYNNCERKSELIRLVENGAATSIQE